MEIKARIPGMVTAVNVKVGDDVKVKTIVGVMEAMKMEQNILAPADGEVTDVAVEAGERVRAGAVLMTVE